MQNLIKEFRSALKQSNLDGFIVTNSVNIFYLTGFRGLSPAEREAILIFSIPAGRQSPKTHLITARLYQNEANKLKSKDLDIKIAAERNEIFKFMEELLKNCKRVGFEEGNLTFLEHKQIRVILSPERSRRTKNLKTDPSVASLPQDDRRRDAKLLPFRDLIESQRIIKTADEIAKIEKAQVISQLAFEKILPTLKVGQTEEEIAERLAQMIKSLGGQGLAFESIIASGPNSGLPHHFTGKRKIKAGEVLLFDFGAKYQNYNADLSRTIFIGKSKDEQKNVFHHVLSAQKAAIAKITSGIRAHDAHELASEIFKQNHLHDYFLHGLGHGIGLEVHEKPHLHPAPSLPSKIKPPDEETLEEGMVFSVEPGLYFPWGGVRIEDLVTIKNGWARVLGKQQESLIEV